MRVTAQTKAATRQRILDTARGLFADRGYDATATRDIARAAGIASGTLFNYFPTKEAIVACLAREAVTQAGEGTRPDGGRAESVEEALFCVIATSLRKLKPLRKHLPILLETSLSPLATGADEDDATSLRSGHLEAVAALAAGHGLGELPSTALQLYWTLFTGVLVFWASDESPNEEDTLALIDDSLNMFVGWLRTHPAAKER
ncbi:MAG TPA: TetR/AcrR family transcriptional regulator [Tepidisphaeraceae bacterium]|jgi:AcrR family transcriptional regulator